MRRLLCLLLGHDWFPTAITRHRWLTWEEPTYFLWEYEEFYCTRCGAHRNGLADQVGSWNQFLDGDAPEWMEGPATQHFPLPEDWGS